MQRVLIGADPVDGGLGSLEGEVRVQLDHGAAGRNHLRSVDLHFIVALRTNQRRRLQK